MEDAEEETEEWASPVEGVVAKHSDEACSVPMQGEGREWSCGAE